MDERLEQAEPVKLFRRPERKILTPKQTESIVSIAPNIMITMLSYLGIYVGGCILSMMFFLMGRWPSLLERDVHWPVIFAWPLVVLWPIHWLGRLGRRRNFKETRLNHGYAKPIEQSVG